MSNAAVGQQIGGLCSSDMKRSDGILATVRVLASDLDGTLLNPDHEPGPGTYDAIRKFQASGGIFAICTGRDKGSARGVLKGLDIDSMPGVYMNGTVVQGLGGTLLQSTVIPEELVQDVVKWARGNRSDASILFVQGEVHYVMDNRDEYALFMHKNLLDPSPVEVEGGWGSPIPKVPRQVNLIRIICSPCKMDRVKPQVQRLVDGRASCAQSLPTTIDIMSPNTNKASGLNVLLKSLGLTEAQTAAIGDSENDLEMLQSVRVACAMGNAVQQTKAVSHFILPKNSDPFPGVVSLLRQLTAAISKAKPPVQQPIISGTTSGNDERRHRVVCFGGGGWGMPVARMVGQSVLQNTRFHDEMILWVNDEIIDGQRLSDVINTTRQNPKHMPGLRVPVNLTAVCDAALAAKDADILIFVERQDVLKRLMKDIAAVFKPSAIVVAMSKDLVEVPPNGVEIKFGCQIFPEILQCRSAVLMGGTLAADVAAGQFAEATLGCDDPEIVPLLLDLFNKPNFSVRCVPSVLAVELFAVLKSIVSLASGISDGLGYGTNTKAAVVRLGAVELNKFAVHFFPQQSAATALNEACGWTDLIVSSFGGSRNRKWAETFAKDPSRSDRAIAADSLPDGAIPTGIQTVLDVARFVRNRHSEMEFPFISKISRIIARQDPPSSLTDMAVPRVRMSNAMRVAVIGSGNWGTAIARIVAENVARQPDFHKKVKMWVFEENIDGRKLTEIINTEHENVKYLGGFKLPDNLVAESDVVETVRGANVLIFVIPHQFLDRILDKIAPVVGPGTLAVSLIKGHIVVDNGGKSLRTGSQVIAEKLGLSECAVLNGANIATDVAEGNFAESTLGCSEENTANTLARLFNSNTFSVRTSPDVLGVELFGGLKNVVALAAGFADGLGLAENTKAAVLRRGLLEMSKFIQYIFPGSKVETMRESCGIADLLTTCYSGRNWKCAKAFASGAKRTWEDIEAELLNGQKLQGPSCCLDVQAIIDHRDLRDEFPLFSSIHEAVMGHISPVDVFTANGFHN